LCSIARDEDPHNIIESIVLKDEFNHKGRPSHCYRITYRSMGSPLKISEMNKINKSIRKRLTEELGVELR
jgi:phenylalanyl-tRNA synthetase alpha chain